MAQRLDEIRATVEAEGGIPLGEILAAIEAGDWTSADALVAECLSADDWSALIEATS